MSSRARLKLKLNTLFGKGPRESKLPSGAAPSDEGRDADGKRENSVEISSQKVPPLVRRSSAPSSLKILNRMNSGTVAETSINASARSAIDFYSDFCQKRGGENSQKRHLRSKSMNDLSSLASARRSNSRALDGSWRDNESAALVDGKRSRKKGGISDRHLTSKHFSDVIDTPSASSRNMEDVPDNSSDGGRLLSSPTSDDDVSYRSCEAVASDTSVSNTTLASAPEDHVRTPKISANDASDNSSNGGRLLSSPTPDDDVSYRSCEAVVGDTSRTSVSNTTLASVSEDNLSSTQNISAEVDKDTPKQERGPAPEHLGHDSLRQDEVGAREEGHMSEIVEKIPRISTEVAHDDGYSSSGHMPGLVESFDLIYRQLNRTEAAKQIVNLITTLEEQRIVKSGNIHCHSSPVDTADLPKKRVCFQLPLPTEGFRSSQEHSVCNSAKSQNDQCHDNSCYSSPVGIESFPKKEMPQFTQPRLPLLRDDWRAYLDDA